jgi:hypothetical protein
MAIQKYFKTARNSLSKYYIQSLAWLRSPHVGNLTLTNFQFLMRNIGTVVTWETGKWNRSAKYTGSENKTAPLILGPISNGPTPNVPELTDSEFFYVDESFEFNKTPGNPQDTPFIIRGIATALTVCLSEPVFGELPYSRNRFYAARFCNHVLEIAAQPASLSLTLPTIIPGSSLSQKTE